MTTTETSQSALTGDGLRLQTALEDPQATWPGVTLREHQLEALDLLAVRLGHGAQRTWIDAPTGSGKTVMFNALAAALGGSALVLVPRKNLATQTLDSAREHFPDLIVHEGADFIGAPGMTVCTYQAALRAEDRIPWEDVTLLICDEAHTALGGKTRLMIGRTDNATVVGFTATGATTTGHVEDVFGPVAATLDRNSAIERGILCPLRSLRVERPIDLSEVQRVRGDFEQGALAKALDRARWHLACVEVWMEHFHTMKLAGVAYTATVAQAEALAEEFRRAGVKAEAVSGQTPKADLQRILDQFGAGEIDVLCNADLLTEGWDETRATVVMHLAPTTSERVFVQRLGRVMRPSAGKEAVSVEFLPPGDEMGVQTSHGLFGMGWYRPLGRVLGADVGNEYSMLAKAAALLEGAGEGAKLVNPEGKLSELAKGLATPGGWRGVDPAKIAGRLTGEWVEAAAREVTPEEIASAVTVDMAPAAAEAWLELALLCDRRGVEGMQPAWRAWAAALLFNPELISALHQGAVREVLERLRMGPHERTRALWWHADQTDSWRHVEQVESRAKNQGKSLWAALENAANWAPAWAWDVSRPLADPDRPGYSADERRLASFHSRLMQTAGSEVGLLGTWLRAIAAPPPAATRPEGEVPLRIGQAARLAIMLGPDDVPRKPEYLRLLARAAAVCGGWAGLRGFLDAVTFDTPETLRSLRAAVGAMQPDALASPANWEALRALAPRLPEAAAAGVEEPKLRPGRDGGDPVPSRRRRKRRRTRPRGRRGTGATADATTNGATDGVAGDSAGESVETSVDASAEPRAQSPADGAAA